VSERAAPFYCPYCGDEDLRPNEAGGHGSWECRSCNRAFSLRFLGLLAEGLTGRDPARPPHGGPS
jgi:transposase-like protein